MAVTDIQTKDRNDVDIDIASKEIGGVKIPRNIIVDPTGNDMTVAKETTAQLLLTAAQAIQAAAEALNTKATVINTGAVALDAGTLAALETINVANFPATQAISALALPLPTGAATQTTLANIDTDLGAQADAAASSDTGTFSVLAFIKRAMQNWTTLLARTPALGAAAASASSPVAIATETATGNITTQNLVPNGAATANSAVEITLNGGTTLSIQTTGTYTGALSVQLTNDNARWETVTVAQIVNAITGVGTATIASAAVGIFTFDCRGFLKARVTGLAAMTGTATVTLRSTLSQSAVTAVQPTAANLNATVSGTVTANVTGYPTATASADALANPTVTKIDATTLLFNGTTWDRARGMSGNLTTGDTGAKVATGNGATLTNVGNKGVQVLVNMGAVTGTTPTAVLKLQGSVDGGTNWFDIPGATTASLTATGLYGITVYPGIAANAGTTTTGTTATVSGVLPRTWRLVWTIGGTTPSFTITNIQYNYLNN